jgi:hypothetical protein
MSMWGFFSLNSARRKRDDSFPLESSVFRLPSFTFHLSPFTFHLSPFTFHLLPYARCSRPRTDLRSRSMPSVSRRFAVNRVHSTTFEFKLRGA